MRNLIAVMIAGGVGAVARYGLDGLVSARSSSSQFPWGTFVVNVSGCLVLGFLYALLTERYTVDPVLRVGLTVGLVGSYTTFSTWALETAQLGQAGSWLIAGANLLANLVVGLLALLAGTAIGRLV